MEATETGDNQRDPWASSIKNCCDSTEPDRCDETGEDCIDDAHECLLSECDRRRNFPEFLLGAHPFVWWVDLAY